MQTFRPVPPAEASSMSLRSRASYLAFLRVEIAAFHPSRKVYLGPDSSLWLYLRACASTSRVKLEVSPRERYPINLSKLKLMMGITHYAV